MVLAAKFIDHMEVLKDFITLKPICLQHLKKKNRVKLVEYFIDVAKECINIGNFNSLMAIIAGMNMNPVARLKKTVCSL